MQPPVELLGRPLLEQPDRTSQVANRTTAIEKFEANKESLIKYYEVQYIYVRVRIQL